jgi:cobalt/nickel transport system permease protein
MHMADALISPAVGGTMWVASAGLIGYCSKKVKNDLDDARIPLMGVVGAFIFAAQMINFTIPGTGSSGHLGGGMILAILLGPYAGFLTMASVLAVQALFFADGGLMALGCNIFNLGFFPCFIAYPLIYKNIAGTTLSERRLFTAAIICAIVGVQLGAFSVVLQTLFSGVTELPFDTFVLLMQPIHLAIGIVEGLATSAVVLFVWKARPEIIKAVSSSAPVGRRSMRKVMVGLLVDWSGPCLKLLEQTSWTLPRRVSTPRWPMFRRKPPCYRIMALNLKKPSSRRRHPNRLWIRARLFPVWSAVGSPCSWPGCSDLRSNAVKKTLNLTPFM